MKLRKKLSALYVAAIAGLAGASAEAGVTKVDFSTGPSANHTGLSFAGSLSYDNDSKVARVEITNTSGFQSVITGFNFNIDGPANGSLSGPVDRPETAGVDEGAFMFNQVHSPLGLFDVGVILKDSASQNAAINDGETGQFSFEIWGPAAPTLTADDFFTQIFNGGEPGLEGAFGVRFAGVGAGNASDHVFASPEAVPLPPAAWAALATMGMTGLGKLRSRLRRAV